MLKISTQERLLERGVQNEVTAGSHCKCVIPSAVSQTDYDAGRQWSAPPDLNPENVSAFGLGFVAQWQSV